MIKNPGNVSIVELFTYDIVSQPSFVSATVTFKEETKSEKRKRKIKKILKNPLN